MAMLDIVIVDGVIDFSEEMYGAPGRRYARIHISGLFRQFDIRLRVWICR